MKPKHLLLSTLMLAGAAACQQPSTEGPQGQTRYSAPAADAPEPVVAPETVAPETVAPPQRVFDEHFVDNNDNGIDDAIDIADQNSLDENNNGIPDEVEADW